MLAHASRQPPAWLSIKRSADTFMLKKLFSLCFAATTAGAALAAEPVSLGSATFSVPSGWSELSRVKDRVVLRSADDRQRATISVKEFASAPSFTDFEIISRLRIEAEKKDAPTVFLQPDEPKPFQDGGRFGLLYSGGDKESARMFSCFLTCSGRELITVYLEAVGVPAKDHLASFQAFVGGLKRK